TERLQAIPRIDETVKAELFITPIASSYVVGSEGSADALEKAEQKLIDLMQAFDYEKQLN
ncbi:MAG TPA: CRISPR-associated protein Cas7, partial [Bacteroidales bacterium]|nr:CRISPR-associated protein Cas7 [Bacteroidales bacterium]